MDALPKVRLKEGWFDMGKSATAYAPADWTPEKGAEAIAKLQGEKTTLKNMVPKLFVEGMTKFDKQQREQKSLNDMLGSLNYKRLDDDEDKKVGMKKGGKVSSASARADGIAIRGKTRA